MKHDAANGDRWAKSRVDEYKDGAKNRQCSYCGHVGHNKRGCFVRKQHRIVYENTLDVFHAEMAASCEKTGISVGSLMKVKRRSHAPVVGFIEQVVIKDKAPDYNWLRAYYGVDNENPKPTEKQLDDWRAIGKYCNSLPSRGSLPHIRLKSIIGTGFGYWGDEETEDCALIEVIASINKTEDSYEVVSVV